MERFSRFLDHTGSFNYDCPVTHSTSQQWINELVRAYYAARPGTERTVPPQPIIPPHQTPMDAKTPGAMNADAGFHDRGESANGARKSVQILVVEDDDDDFFLTERALRKFCAGRIQHVDSGRATIDYLSGAGSYADREKFPMPDVMFLDLKLDQISGHDVLRWVSSNLVERRPKIFVLTGSNEPRDRDLVESSGAAAGYIVKPLTTDHLSAIIDAADLFGTAASNRSGERA
jgi:CheY-like chemotaxis protein